MQEKITILEKTLLSDNWATLHKVVYETTTPDGDKVTGVREVYDRGNGATILLYNKQKGTVVLIQQVRLPTYFNGNPTGLLIEACAGLVDNESPEENIRRETQEETGYIVGEVTKIMESYMSPGSVTEIIHFFAAPYSDDRKSGDGGGLDEEQEHIEVLEMPFSKAFNMIKTGEIKDAKTIMLLQWAKIEGIFN